MSRQAMMSKRTLAVKAAAALRVVVDAMSAAYVDSTGLCVRVHRHEDTTTRTRFWLDTSSRTPASAHQREAAKALAEEWKKRTPESLKPEDAAIVFESSRFGLRLAITHRERDVELWTPDNDAPVLVH